LPLLALHRIPTLVVRVASALLCADATEENSGISPSTKVGCVRTASRSAV